MKYITPIHITQDGKDANVRNFINGLDYWFTSAIYKWSELQSKYR